MEKNKSQLIKRFFILIGVGLLVEVVICILLEAKMLILTCSVTSKGFYSTLDIIVPIFIVFCLNKMEQQLKKHSYRVKCFFLKLFVPAIISAAITCTYWLYKDDSLGAVFITLYNVAVLVSIVILQILQYVVKKCVWQKDYGYFLAYTIGSSLAWCLAHKWAMLKEIRDFPSLEITPVLIVLYHVGLIILVLSILFLLIYIIKKIVQEKQSVNIVKQLLIIETTFIAYGLTLSLFLWVAP